MLDLPDVVDLEVAVDTESSGLYVDDYAYGSKHRCRLSVVSIAWVRPEDGGINAVVFPFDQERYNDKRDDGDRPMLWDGEDGGSDPNLGEQEWLELLGWLSRQRLIGQKFKHDLHFLRAGTRQWPGIDLDRAVYWDTLLASRLLEPTLPAGLDAIGKRHFGQGKSDGEMNKLIAKSKGRYGTPAHPRLDLIPWGVMRGYAEQDATLTLMVYLWQRDAFARCPDLMPHFEQEMALLPILYRMERAGVEFDEAQAETAVVACLKRMEALEVDLAFEPLPDKAAAWFFGVKKAEPHCMTSGRTFGSVRRPRPSMQACCVRWLTQSPDVEVAEQATLYTRWSKINSVVVKYYRGWAEQVGEDGRLRTDFNQTGTISNRFSSVRVNLQSVPNEYQHEAHLADVPGVVLPRYLLFPDREMEARGMTVVEFDLEQAELRMAAHYAGCRTMRNLLESGADVHGETAEMLFGSRAKAKRQVAKRCNFAMIYDVSWRTFQADVQKQIGLQLSDEEAQDIHSAWRNLYPEFHSVNDKASRLAVRRGWVLLWDGRRRYFSDHELKTKPYKAFNQVIQGGIAQIVKQWMLEVEDKYPGVLRLQVHDSIVCVLPVDQVRKASDRIARMGSRIATEAAGIQMLVSSKPWRER